MQVRRLLPLSLSLVVVLWAFGVTAQPPTFKTEMFGGYVVGGGDSNGFGAAMLTVEKGADRELFTINYIVQAYKIAKPAAVHIHEGGPGQNGSIVATLKTIPSGDNAIDGVIATREIWGRRLFLSPNDFYIDVHTEQFPNGALRGQLD